MGGIISGAVTYIVCLTIMKANGYFSRDIMIPFFSDIGRDLLNYYIFVVGLTIAGISTAIISWVTYKECTLPKLREVGQKMLFWIAYAILTCSLLSCPFLPMIAIFPVHSDHEIHVKVAKCYFLHVLFAPPES